jgi:hypothetical protein
MKNIFSEIKFMVCILSFLIGVFGNFYFIVFALGFVSTINEGKKEVKNQLLLENVLILNKQFAMESKYKVILHACGDGFCTIYETQKGNRITYYDIGGETKEKASRKLQKIINSKIKQYNGKVIESNYIKDSKFLKRVVIEYKYNGSQVFEICYINGSSIFFIATYQLKDAIDFEYFIN